MADEVNVQQTLQMQAAMESIAKAQRESNALFEQAAVSSGKSRESLLKQAEILSRIAKQGQDMLKAKEAEEDAVLRINKAYEKKKKLEDEIRKLSQADAKEDREALDRAKEMLRNEEKQLETEKKLVIERAKNREESERSYKELVKQNKELGKTKSLLSEAFSSGKAQAAAYLASIASIGFAFQQLQKLSTDMLDISVLSGNYSSLKMSTGELVMAAGRMQTSMAEARVGLRLLGYEATEVNQAYKDLSVTLGKFDGSAAANKKAADLTTVVGQLARVTGVTLSEATQHFIDVSEKFSATNAQTARSLQSIYLSSKQYNEEAGKMIFRARDVSKVMFDIARESEGAAFQQDVLAKVLAQNLVSLQAQGRNYQEALRGASTFVRKMTTEAPPWAKIMAGRELAASIKVVQDEFGNLKLDEQMAKQLDAARPGLSKRVEEIYQTVSDPFTRGQLLQQALEGTQVGLDAMNKSILTSVEKLDNEGKKIQAIKALLGLKNETEAQSALAQARALDKVQAQQNKLYEMSDQERASALQHEMGMSKGSAEYLSKVENSARLREALLDRYTQKEKNSLKERLDDEQQKRAKQLQETEKALRAAKASGDTQLQKILQSEIDDLKNSVEAVKGETAKDLEATQGGKAAKDIFKLVEGFKNPITQIALSTMAMAAAQSGNLIKGGKAVLGGTGLSGLGEAAGKEAAARAAASSSKGAGAVMGRLAGAGAVLKGAGKILGRTGLLAAGYETAMGAYDTYSDYENAETAAEKAAALKRGALKTGGAAAGGAGGAAAGAAAGALAGTVIFPGVGTVVGGALGGILGGWGGAELGKWSGGKLYDSVGTPASATPEMMQQSVSPAPSEANPAQPSQGSMQNLRDAMGGNVIKTARVVPGSQGFDMELGIKIPFSEAFAANMNLMKTRGSQGMGA